MKICPLCLRILEEKKDFYFYKDFKTSYWICKECTKKDINDYDPETFLWLCKDFDIPYIEEEWATLRDRVMKKRASYSVFGKYLSKMKLCSWRTYTYKDTAKINKMITEKRVFKEERDQELKELYERLGIE